MSGNQGFGLFDRSAGNGTDSESGTQQYTSEQQGTSSTNYSTTTTTYTSGGGQGGTTSTTYRTTSSRDGGSGGQYQSGTQYSTQQQSGGAQYGSGYDAQQAQQSVHNTQQSSGQAGLLAGSSTEGSRETYLPLAVGDDGAEDEEQTPDRGFGLFNYSGSQRSSRNFRTESSTPTRGSRTSAVMMDPSTPQQSYRQISSGGGGGTYSTQSSGGPTYATQSSTQPTYSTQSSGGAAYVPLTQGSEAPTSATQSSREATYATQSSGGNTYAAQTSDQPTYSTQSSGEATYANQGSGGASAAAQTSREAASTSQGSRGNTYTAQTSDQPAYATQRSGGSAYTTQTAGGDQRSGSYSQAQTQSQTYSQQTPGATAQQSSTQRGGSSTANRNISGQENSSSSDDQTMQGSGSDEKKQQQTQNHLQFSFDNEGGEPRRSTVGEIDAGNEEYTNLVKYISTYRDGRRKSTISLGSRDVDDDDEKEKVPKWKFWKKKNEEEEEAFQAPEEWMQTEMKQGLSDQDVLHRRKKAGWNELTTEKENMFLKFLSYFQGPILYVMEIAVIIAAGLEDWIDFGVIIGILMLNAIVGWYQEKQAADVVASLKGDIAMKAQVIRNGQESEIKARELVPGDIVIVEEGEVIPADASLITGYDNPEGFEDWKKLRDEDPDQTHEHDNGEKGEDDDSDDEEDKGHPIVACDQSAITGESLAVDKFMGDTLFYTTGCKRGKGYALVTASARSSFVGRTATLVQTAKDQGHFKAIMNSIGTSLLVLVVAWIIIAWIGGFYRGLAITTPTWSSVNLMHYILILLIIGVPVGLPVVTTTTLAVGAAYLAKEKAIVQKLTAIESLAGVDILCSDKTGTLTANQLSIREPYTAEGVDVNWMMAVAALASSHNIKSLDPIDKVTILTLKRYPKARDILMEGWTTHKFTPFDPVSKRITAECEKGGTKYTAAKGAPKAILNLTNCSQEDADRFKEKSTDFARRGFRSLGVAVKENDGDWQLLGMLPMFDPPREDTASTIAEAQTLGLEVKMLTGDAIAIAKETCKMLALGTKVYNSERLIHGGLSGTTQHDLAESADGFAEVFPEHKYQVVEMLQQRGHLTAMTGDGVNDAPSLKKSDCGIAVEGASEAAQAAADIVFLAPGLSTIVSAIKIARQIFQRMKAYIQYRIALCLHLEIYLVSSMVGINETIRADLVVFLALFADLATVAVAYDNAHYEPRPVEWQLPKIWIISVILGFMLAVGTWIVRGSLYLPDGGIVQNYGNIQEILFLQVSLTENWLIFVTRGGNTWPSWQLVCAILGVDALATIFAIFGWLSGDPQSQLPSPRGNGWTQPESGHVDVVTVVVIWMYSIFVTIVIAIAYFILNKVPVLNDIGRAKRSVQDTQMENILSHLSKLAIEHEKDSKNGKSRFILATKATEAEQDE